MAEGKTKRKVLSSKITIPKGVEAKLDKAILILKGAKGEVKRDFSDKKINISYAENEIILKAVKFDKVSKKLIKSYAAHIKNMIGGSLVGHKYTLKICSGHSPMNVSASNNQLIVKNFLGEKIPRTLNLKEGAAVKVEGDLIVVESSSKEIAGQVSADIEQLTKRAGYDGRVFQDGCYIISKDGKEIK
jgi:large subunit ribosomal protein L6